MSKLDVHLGRELKPNNRYLYTGTLIAEVDDTHWSVTVSIPGMGTHTFPNVELHYHCDAAEHHAGVDGYSNPFTAGDQVLVLMDGPLLPRFIVGFAGGRRFCELELWEDWQDTTGWEWQSMKHILALCVGRGYNSTNPISQVAAADETGYRFLQIHDHLQASRCDETNPYGGWTLFTAHFGRPFEALPDPTSGAHEFRDWDIWAHAACNLGGYYPDYEPLDECALGYIGEGWDWDSWQAYCWTREPTHPAWKRVTVMPPECPLHMAPCAGDYFGTWVDVGGGEHEVTFDCQDKFSWKYECTCDGEDGRNRPIEAGEYAHFYVLVTNVSHQGVGAPSVVFELVSGYYPGGVPHEANDSPQPYVCQDVSGVPNPRLVQVRANGRILATVELGLRTGYLFTANTNGEAQQAGADWRLVTVGPFPERTTRFTFSIGVRVWGIVGRIAAEWETPTTYPLGVQFADPAGFYKQVAFMYPYEGPPGSCFCAGLDEFCAGYCAMGQCCSWPTGLAETRWLRGAPDVLQEDIWDGYTEKVRAFLSPIEVSASPTPAILQKPGLCFTNNQGVTAGPGTRYFARPAACP